MNRKINILIYPSGSENAIEVKEALNYQVNITVFGASSKKDHSLFIYKKFFYAPNINDINFLEKFNQLINKHEIDIIIPTHDSVALFLSKNIKNFSATVITSNYETNLICRHKQKTYFLFEKYSFALKVYRENEIPDYPCFIKPNIGEGGKNTLIAYSENEIKAFEQKNKDLMFLKTEYLTGKEYTVDCFTDRNRILRFVGPRIRNRVFGGISVNSFTVDNEFFFKIAEDINNEVHFRGYWFFQVKEDLQGNLKLLEISSRAAGTMSLYRQRGINFMLLSIYDFLGFDIEIIDNKNDIELDRFLMSRYKQNLFYKVVYIDFDDTIIVNNSVNTFSINFLYQAKRDEKKIILLTKHSGDIYLTLKSMAISEYLFDEIIQIKGTENKVDYIKYEEAIFIDNSFFERKKVFEILNIPVFDVDAISSLIDWRS